MLLLQGYIAIFHMFVCVSWIKIILLGFLALANYSKNEKNEESTVKSQIVLLNSLNVQTFRIIVAILDGAVVSKLKVTLKEFL